MKRFKRSYLDLDESIEEHWSTLLHVNIVGDILGLVVRVIWVVKRYYQEGVARNSCSPRVVDDLFLLAVPEDQGGDPFHLHKINK